MSWADKNLLQNSDNMRIVIGLCCQCINNLGNVNFTCRVKKTEFIFEFAVSFRLQEFNIRLERELCKNLQSWVTPFDSLINENSLRIQHLIIHLLIWLSESRIKLQNDSLIRLVNVGTSQNFFIKRASINQIDVFESSYAFPQRSRNRFNCCNNYDVLQIVFQVACS